MLLFAASTVLEHKQLRDKLETALRLSGFSLTSSEGTFSIFAGSRPLSFLSGEDCCRHLLAKHQILAVPGETFFRPGKSTSYVRFCFARSASLIDQAVSALSTSVEAA
ncbi:MAG: aminotransferase class I/II-fold pyridoxal phosphate-dependent enzyme [Candidatus Obscuribacterales bacterium]|nr:aminotransferase class I/II-fold pyridoxal phosphate-dependent enzyme [Candidatus Obscuribacterales bacterium]